MEAQDKGFFLSSLLGVVVIGYSFMTDNYPFLIGSSLLGMGVVLGFGIKDYWSDKNG